MPISANQTSLWDLPAGGTALIAGINGGIDAATQRLIDIGFREGQRVTCLLTPGFGAPRVFAVGGATYSLNRAIAERVQTIEPDL
ncbi:MAG: FeoA family protein [Halieaceae bacterium]|jgi:Fe2+ transport system protein FeoA